MFRTIFTLIVGVQLLLGSGRAYAQTVNKIPPFDESVWRVEHLLNQEKTIQSYQGEKNYTSISFNPYTHKITGRGLCNKFMAKFEQHNNQIIIKDLVTTHEVCLSQDVNTQDERFFRYLKSVKSYSVHGKILRLNDAQNQALIIARWAK